MVRKQKIVNSNEIFSAYLSAIMTEAEGCGVTTSMTDNLQKLTSSWGGEPRIKLKFKEGQVVFSRAGVRFKITSVHRSLVMVMDQHDFSSSLANHNIMGHENTGRLPKVPHRLAKTKTAKLLRLLAAMASIKMTGRNTIRSASPRMQLITHQLSASGSMKSGESGLYMRSLRYRQRCVEAGIGGGTTIISRASGLDEQEIDSSLFVSYDTASSFDIDHTGKDMTW